jgi:hypothetical protein
MARYEHGGLATVGNNTSTAMQRSTRKSTAESRSSESSIPARLRRTGSSFSLLLCLVLLMASSLLVQQADAAAIEKRDADFASVRYKLTKERSGRGGDPKQKYFHESV